MSDSASRSFGVAQAPEIPLTTTPQFTYSLSLQDANSDGVTYLTVNENATLTLILSNPGNPVTLNSLTLNVSLGNNATDLAAPGDVTPVLPSENWTANGLTFTPPGGSISVAQELTFEFKIIVNGTPGGTPVSVTEVTEKGTAGVSFPAVAKMPASFQLTGLSASPTQVNLGDTVTLTWTGTPNQAYTITWTNGPAGGVSATSPSGGITSYPFPNFQPTSTPVVFIVAATVQGATVSANTAVNVNLPEIQGFSQPQPYYSSATRVTLTWKTLNADHCQVWADGAPVDANAPANSPEGGYIVNPQPTAPVTRYVLYAYSGSTSSLGQSVEVRFVWTTGGSINGVDSSDGLSMLLSKDGKTLYVRGKILIIVDTQTMSASVTSSDHFIVGGNSCALTPPLLSLRQSMLALIDADSTLLFELNSGDSMSSIGLCSLMAANPGSGPVPLNLSEDSLQEYTVRSVAVSPKGDTLWVAIFYYFSTTPNPNTVVYNYSIPSYQFREATTVNGQAYWMQPSADGSTLLVQASSGISIIQNNFAVPAGSLYGDSGVFVMSPDGNSIYGGSNNGTGRVVIAQYSLPGPGPKPINEYVLFDPPPGGVQWGLTSMGSEPTGSIFAVLVVSGLNTPTDSGVGNGLNVFILPPGSSEATLFYYSGSANNEAITMAVVSDALGEKLYLSTADQVVQFVKNTLS